MKSLLMYIKESMSERVINNLEVTYAVDNNDTYIDCPETYQEDDIHQYIDDLLLEQMPSNQDVAKKYFHNNVKYINDAYFEYDGFQRLSYKKDTVDIEYDKELGKDVPEDVKIVTFKLTGLKFKMLFSKFELMLNDENDSIEDVIGKIFSAYESNDYNDTDIKFKYVNCEYDN